MFLARVLLLPRVVSYPLGNLRLAMQLLQFSVLLVDPGLGSVLVAALEVWVLVASRRSLLRMVLVSSVLEPRRYEHSVPLRWKTRKMRMVMRTASQAEKPDTARHMIMRIRDSMNRTVSCRFELIYASHTLILSIIVETGEEGELTVFSCKAKLYHFTGKEWKERGIGTFKLNVTEAENESRKTARLIMRTVGVFRVVLNTPVFKGMKIGDNAGREPTGKMINLAGVEKGKPVPLMLKVSLLYLSTGSNNKKLTLAWQVGAAEVAKELYRKIQEVQQRL